MLYKFHKLKEHLDKKGYPPASGGRGYKRIEKNLATEFKNGKIVFEEGEIIYVGEDGVKHKTYTYLPNADIQANGYPKFHLTNCKTIEEFRANHRFNTKYIVGNAEKVNITDRNTGIVHKDISLELCRNCSNMLGRQNKVLSTADFYNSIPKEAYSPDTPVNSRGYTLDWEYISKGVREAHQYTCSACKIQVTDPLDRMFIQVHHKNGNKLNNTIENLVCLCIHCHSQVDDHHRKQFAGKRQQAGIKKFLERYKPHLL